MIYLFQVVVGIVFVYSVIATPTGEPSGEPSGQPTGEPSGEPTGRPTDFFYTETFQDSLVTPSSGIMLT